MEYTKGEWKAYIFEDIQRADVVAHGKPFAPPMVNFQGIIATIEGKDKSWVERKSNAHLIAAAPYMHEALKLYQSHQEGTSGHYCYKCANAINKALAKAEGK